MKPAPALAGLYAHDASFAPTVSGPADRAQPPWQRRRTSRSDANPAMPWARFGSHAEARQRLPCPGLPVSQRLLLHGLLGAAAKPPAPNYRHNEASAEGGPAGTMTLTRL